MDHSLADGRCDIIAAPSSVSFQGLRHRWLQVGAPWDVLGLRQLLGLGVPRYTGELFFWDAGVTLYVARGAGLGLLGLLAYPWQKRLAK